MAGSKSKTTPVAPRPKSSDTLWLACFQYDQPSLPGTRRPSGSFQIVVRAKSVAKALDACAARLRELRATTTMFDTPCTIILDHVIDIGGVAEKPALVNYVSKLPMEAAVEGDPEILCGLPEQSDLALGVYGPKEKKDGSVEPFVDFGGTAAQEYLTKAIAKNRSGR